MTGNWSRQEADNQDRLGPKSLPLGAAGADDVSMAEPSVPTTSEQPSILYDRVGETAIAEIVDRFYGKVLGDPEIGEFFKYTSMPRLQKMQREFFAAALGAPTAYSGRDIHDMHAMLGIEQHHFSRFVELLIDTMNELEVDDEVIDGLIARLSLRADDVVGGQGEDG